MKKQKSYVRILLNVQYSSSNSKNRSGNSIKSSLLMRKQPLSKTMSVIRPKIFGLYVMKDFLFLVPISKETRINIGQYLEY